MPHYVIDEDFNVLFSYEGNQEFFGGYIKIPSKMIETNKYFI